MTQDDTVHTWKNFLKNYQHPTVQAISIQGSPGEMILPIGTAVAVILLFPLCGLWFWRRQHNEPVKGMLILIIVVFIAGGISYPFLQLNVKRPAVMARPMNQEEAKALLQSLLKNVYRAFDFRDEEAVYDKLALTVNGDFLADLYLQNRASFAVKKAGGAQAKIKQVDVQNAQAETLSGQALAYKIKGQWTALGSVGHWGHVHQRKNYYEAMITVEAIDGRWKITGLELLEEKRIAPNAPAINQDKDKA